MKSGDSSIYPFPVNLPASPSELCKLSKCILQGIEKECAGTQYLNIDPNNPNLGCLRSLYDGMTCQVIHNNDLSSPFTVTTGVRHGCLLSLMIFSLVVNWVLNQTMDQPRSLQWTFVKSLEDLDFADDIGLLSHYFKHIQEKSRRLSTVAL